MRHVFILIYSRLFVITGLLATKKSINIWTGTHFFLIFALYQNVLKLQLCDGYWLKVHTLNFIKCI